MKRIPVVFLSIFILIISVNVMIAQQVNSMSIKWVTGKVLMNGKKSSISIQIVRFSNYNGFVIADDVFLYKDIISLASGLGKVKSMKLVHWDGDDQVVYSDINYIARLKGDYIVIDLVVINHNILSGYIADTVMSIGILYNDLR